MCPVRTVEDLSSCPVSGHVTIFVQSVHSILFSSGWHFFEVHGFSCLNLNFKLSLGSWASATGICFMSTTTCTVFCNDICHDLHQGQLTFTFLPAEYILSSECLRDIKTAQYNGGAAEVSKVFFYCVNTMTKYRYVFYLNHAHTRINRFLRQIKTGVYTAPRS